MPPSDSRTVVIHRRYFTMDVCDGDILTTYEPTETIACADAAEAIQTLTAEGLTGPYALSVHPVPATFSGHEWLSLPEGSVPAGNDPGARMEASAHLHGWTPEEFAHIMRTVTGMTRENMP
jgi:hypothetical protein